MGCGAGLVELEVIVLELGERRVVGTETGATTVNELAAASKLFVKTFVAAALDEFGAAAGAGVIYGDRFEVLILHRDGLQCLRL